jgi:hypothetical protein
MTGQFRPRAANDVGPTPVWVTQPDTVLYLLMFKGLTIRDLRNLTGLTCGKLDEIMDQSILVDQDEVGRIACALDVTQEDFADIAFLAAA